MDETLIKLLKLRPPDSVGSIDKSSTLLFHEVLDLFGSDVTR
jgi:hypothetical protein